MMEAKITRTGKLKIPKSMRKKYGLNKGHSVQLVDYGGVVTIHSVPEDSIAFGTGLLKGNTSLSKMMVEEHRKDW